MYYSLLKKSAGLLMAFVVGIGCSFGQNQVLGGNQSSGMDMNTIPGGVVSQFGAVQKVTKGSKYLYPYWQFAKIETSSGMIDNCPVNYDVQNQVLEINTDQGVRVLPMHIVQRLTVVPMTGQPQVFQNSKQYDAAKLQIRGLMEVLATEGDVVVLKHYYNYVKEGHYNATLDMGNNADVHVTKHRYFLFADNTLTELPESKSRFIDLFSETDQNIVKSFIKENKLKTKEEADILRIVAFLREKNILPAKRV